MRRTTLYIVLALSTLLSSGNTTPQEQGTRPLRAVGYYLAVRAELDGRGVVNVFGASNLPAGSILWISVYDFIGEGSSVLNDEADVPVGSDGLFRVAVRAKSRRSFKRNYICSVTFVPTYPQQPAEALEIVGKTGEHLGDPFKNPQIVGNFRVQMLDATTVVQ